MSPVPRPTSQSPSRQGSNGGRDQSCSAAGGTTSTCALSPSDVPVARAVPHRDDVALPGHLPRERRRERVRAQRLLVHRHVDGLETELVQSAGDDRLRGFLLAEHRRAADELAEQRLHPLRLATDGGGDLAVRHRRLRTVGGRHAGERTTLLDRVGRHFDAAYTGLVATVSGTRTLPYDWYVDPAVLRLEQELLFGRFWQYACRSEQVAEPGAIATAHAGTVPLIVVRGRDAELRAFVNVCRHRGFVLCDADDRRETIQCPYHAWTYDLDGSLRSAPRGELEPGFDRDALGLVAVAVDEWGPFVFVNRDLSAEPLATFLGELPSLLATGGIELDALRFHERTTSEPYACNWKVCAENFLECYHCAVAHPALSKAIDVSKDGYRLETHRWFSSQRSPARNGGGGVYDATGDIAQGQFYYLFPNTVINVMPGRPNLSIGPILPLSTDRTTRFLDYFVGPGVDDAWLADYLALDELVGVEDRVLVERVQRGIASGGLPWGSLMPESERLIAHFQALVAEALGDQGT